MIAKVFSSASMTSSARRGLSRSSSQPSPAGSANGVEFGARLAQDVAQPVDPCPGDVAGDRPDRPVLRRGPERELLRREVADRIDKTSLVLRPAVIEESDRHRSIVPMDVSIWSVDELGRDHIKIVPGRDRRDATGDGPPRRVIDVGDPGRDLRPAAHVELAEDVLDVG